MFSRGVVNWEASEWAEIAIGAEYTRNHFGAPWGKSEKDMRLGDNGIIVSGPNSNAILEGNSGSADKDSTAIFVGSGWSTNSYALFSEANVALRPWLKLLISGRVDKITFTKKMFSPRVAIIASVGDGHFVKLIAQKSVRSNTASQLFTEAHNGHETNTETLRGLELIYTRFISNGWRINITGTRNTVDVIAWDGDENVTKPSGRLQLFGVEADVRYKWSKGNAGASYSYVKQIDWDLADGVSRSGVSFADYNQPIGDGIQAGVGNDLANWPGHALKFFGRASLSNQMTVHINSRILWDYQGMKDGLTGLSQAMQGTADETVVETAIQQVNAVNSYDYDFRANASLTYRLSNYIELQVFMINILGANGNKRYSYDNGNDDPAPTGVRFIEEPRTWGMRVEYDF